MRKILPKLLTGMSIGLFVMTITLLILGTRAARENTLIDVFGFSYSVVGSDSMNTDAEDGFATGDILILRTVSFAKIHVGDIIAFRSLNEPIYIVHRVIEINEDGHLITQGDANPTVDVDPVTPDNYFGQVIQHFDSSGVGQIILNYRSVLFTIIIGIFILIMILEVLGLFKSIKEKQTLEAEERLQKRQAAQLDAEREKIREELKAELQSKSQDRSPKS